MMYNLCVRVGDFMFFLSNDYCVGILGREQGIPGAIGDLIHYIYIGIKIVVPILLVIFAMLDLGKAITAKKEEDIKKYQSSCIKRVVTGVLVFLVVIIVEFILGFVEPKDSDSGKSPVSCATEIIRGKSGKKGSTNVTHH